MLWETDYSLLLKCSVSWEDIWRFGTATVAETKKKKNEMLKKCFLLFNYS